MQLKTFIKQVGCFTLGASLLFGTVGCGSRSSAKRKPLAFEKWADFKSPDSTFTVKFPKQPKENTILGKSTDYKSYTSRNKGESYYAGCSTAKTDAVAEARDKDSQVTVRRANVFSKQQKDVTFCGEPAKEMTWDANGYHYRGFVLKTHQGTHVYTLWARWKSNTEPGNAAKFFDSFKPGAYTPRPTPTVTPDADKDDEQASATPEPDSDGGDDSTSVSDDEGSDSEGE